jgi:signal transduction histidine kinase
MKHEPERPVKILVVDDREENRVSLSALLRRDDLEILLASSGDQALDHLLNHDVALALLDVQMPDMDGFALAELMRGAQRTRHVPIIFVTANHEERQRIFRGYDAGAVDFLFKPIDTRVLRHKVDVFVRLYRQRQELAETLRFNELFVATVGHDLKNPLHAIGLAADILAQSKDDATRRTAERLRSSTRRMRAIVDDLFDLARARLGGGIPIEPLQTDLVGVVRKVLGEFATTNAESVVTFDDATGARGAVGEWDGGRLGQVVTNLVGNALRHGRPGAPVTVRVGTAGERVEFSVHNAGAIAADVRKSLFDPFRSASETKTRAGGLGLGLYIVSQLVAAHGGDIDVESTDTGGTTFTVTLPRQVPPVREPAPSSSDA